MAHSRISMVWQSLALCTAIALIYFFIPPQIGKNDIQVYWAASALFLSGKNPYDPIAFTKMMQQMGAGEGTPMLFYLPPHSFSIIGSFALLPLEVFTRIWFIISVFCLLFAYQSLLPASRGASQVEKHAFAIEKICLISFWPFALCIYLGQLSPLVLVLLTIFLRRYAKNANEFCVGFFLGLTSVKPNLLFLLYLAFFYLAISNRHYRALLGFLCCVALMSLLPLLISPSLLGWFFENKAIGLLSWRTPTLGSWLLEFTSNGIPWVRFLPALLAALGLMYYLNKKETAKNSEVALFLPLIALSLFTTPYAWTYEFVLLLPPLIYCIRGGAKSHSQGRLYLIGSTLLLGNIALAIGSREMRHGVWYSGLVFALCVLVYSPRSQRENRSLSVG